MSVPARPVDLAPAPSPTAPTSPVRPARTEAPIDFAPGRDDRGPGEPSTPRRRRGGRGPTGVDPRPGHIPGLDGLRAIAIVGVLVYHLLPATLPGGFLGVDVFFVVSGFLITTLLLREVDAHGRLDLPAFWTRRARRLLPALVLVVVASTAAARLVGGDLLVGIGRQALGALTFTTNWLEVAAGASYFQNTSPVLLLNLWSLAVEEQFYLLWPLSLVLVLALTRGTRQRVGAVAGVGLVSALLMAVLYQPGADATRVYYGTDTHLVGLMAGAALAVAWADPRHRAGLRTPVWRRWRGPAVLTSLLVLVGLMRLLAASSSWTYRGGIALASLASVVLIAGLLEADGPWRRVMSLPPLRWLGERSYGLYLWHWPVLLVLTEVVPWAPGTLRGTMVLLATLTLTVVLSEASLRWVETPVRRHGLRASVRRLGAWLATPWSVDHRPRLVAAGLGLALLAGAVALVTAPETSRTQQQIEDAERRMGATAPTATSSGGAASQPTGSASTPTASSSEPTSSASGSTTTGSTTTGSTTTGSTATSSAAAGTTGAADAAGAVTVNGTRFTADADGLLVPPGKTLTAFGDSLVVTAADGLSARFPGTAYLALSNRQWGDGAGVLTEALAAGEVRDNVVLHLGTNAGVDEKALRAALEALGPERNVVVLDLYVAASFTEGSNATIREVVADFPNAVVGQWAAAATNRPGMLQADRVHPDLDGMHVYAEVVAEAFDELARRDS